MYLGSVRSCCNPFSTLILLDALLGDYVFLIRPRFCFIISAGVTTPHRKPLHISEVNIKLYQRHGAYDSFAG